MFLAMAARSQDINIDFQVDMDTAHLGAQGGTCAVTLFDPSSDVVEAMGNLYNNWTAVESVNCGQPFSALPTDFNRIAPGSLIYHRDTTLVGAQGMLIQFKYRIDHSWDNDELRGVGNGNRNITLPTASTIVIASIFNDSSNTVTVVSGLQNVQLAKIQSIYPNPVNNRALLTYIVLHNDPVNVYISDVLGKTVKTIESGDKSLGFHQVEMNLSDLSNGIYFVTVKVGNSSATKKINVVH